LAEASRVDSPAKQLLKLALSQDIYRLASFYARK